MMAAIQQGMNRHQLVFVHTLLVTSDLQMLQANASTMYITYKQC